MSSLGRHCVHQALRLESTINILGTQAQAGWSRSPWQLSWRRFLVPPTFTTWAGRKRGEDFRHRFSFSGLETRWDVMGLDGQHVVLRQHTVPRDRVAGTNCKRE